MQLFLIRYLFEPFIVGPYQRRMLPVLFGPIYFQALSSAVRFGLFTKLAERRRMTRSDIAAALGIGDKEARVLIDVLVTLGLVKRSRAGGEPTYRNPWPSTLYFSDKSQYRINAIVQWYNHIVYKPMYHFYDALRAGQNVGLQEISGYGDTIYQRLTDHRDLEKIFQDAMEQISFLANRSLADYLDFSDVQFVVDVGGGNASNIITLARRYPHLKAAVFDSATVQEIARDNIEHNGLGNRLATITGDCFVDPYPTDADCYLYCHFLDIWSEEQNRQLIAKTFAALPKGGRIIVFDIMQHDDGKGPLTSAAGHPYFLTLATGDGFIYAAREYEDWIRNAGFTQVRRVRLPQDHIAVIGKK